MTRYSEPFGWRFIQDPDNRDWTYDCDGHKVPLVDGEPDYTRRYTEDMDDPSDNWDCSPPVDTVDYSMWMNNFIELHVGHEKMRTPWTEREKNLRALRARFENDA